MIPPPADVGRGRGVATGRRVVAELAVAVPTPALEEHDAREVRARVAPAGIQHLDGAIRDDRGRGVAIGRRAVAELAAAVVAPALEERAGRQVRTRVGASERQHPNGAADVDSGRRVAIGIRAVAELAVFVPAPALEERADRYARVGVSEGQYLDGATEVDRGRGVAIGIRAVAELASVVSAPALKCGIGLHAPVRARVGVSECQHPDDGATRVDCGRGAATGRRAVAELACAVRAPALEKCAGREVRA
jgi:hypothetical protein